jgi:hypothetical protein
MIRRRKQKTTISEKQTELKKERKGTIVKSISFKPEVLKAVDSVSKETGRDRSNFINYILSLFLKKKHKKELKNLDIKL